MQFFTPFDAMIKTPQMFSEIFAIVHMQSSSSDERRAQSCMWRLHKNSRFR